MKLKKAIQILDSSIPAPDNKMVDMAHKEIAIAWGKIKHHLEPQKVTDIHVDEYYCPSCGAENICDQGKVCHKFCPNCGQALEV